MVCICTGYGLYSMYGAYINHPIHRHPLFSWLRLGIMNPDDPRIRKDPDGIPFGAPGSPAGGVAGRVLFGGFCSQRGGWEG